LRCGQSRCGDVDGRRDVAWQDRLRQALNDDAARRAANEDIAKRTTIESMVRRSAAKQLLDQSVVPGIDLFAEELIGSGIVVTHQQEDNFQPQAVGPHEIVKIPRPGRSDVVLRIWPWFDDGIVFYMTDLGVDGRRCPFPERPQPSSVAEAINNAYIHRLVEEEL
jgi:hypothetical protein